MRERQAAIRAALLGLNGQRMLPFSPMVYLGLSADEFGGGSNLADQPVGSAPFAAGTPRFGAFAPRTDFDAMAYWTLRNIGLGNRAQIDAAASRLRSADWQRLGVVEQVRMQVANAYVRRRPGWLKCKRVKKPWQRPATPGPRTCSAFAVKKACRSKRKIACGILPARLAYLTAILEYNRAQFELYVALGQPPADALVRQVPANESELPPPSVPAAQAADKDGRP